MSLISVDKFISNFKKGFDEEYLEEVFSNGNCYHFALILSQMFDGEINYDPHNQHFVTEIGASYYDITGKVPAPMDTLVWNDMSNISYYDSEEYEMIKRTCVYKNA